MNQDDWSSFLKAKLDDRNPKCGNCKWWKRSDDRPTFGGCSYATAGLGYASLAIVTDLSLCSVWEKAPKPDPDEVPGVLPA